MSQTKRKRNDALINRKQQRGLQQQFGQARNMNNAFMTQLQAANGPDADLDNALRALRPDAIGDIENAQDFQALNHLSQQPILNQYNNAYNQMTGDHSARNMTDSSLAAYQKHMLNQGRDEGLLDARMKSILGTQGLRQEYANALQQARQQRIGQLISSIGAGGTMQQMALDPVMKNNGRGYYVAKTGIGNAFDFWNSYQDAIWKPFEKASSVIAPFVGGRGGEGMII